MADIEELDLEEEEERAPSRDPNRKKSKSSKKARKSLSEEEKWVSGGLAVMVPAVGLLYRDEIEAWLYDNRVWLIGLAVLLLGSCVVAMGRAARGKRTRGPKSPKVQHTAVFGAEGLEPSLPASEAGAAPFPAPTGSAGSMGAEGVAPALTSSPSAAFQAPAPDDAPALAAALKLDYSGGKPRTVRRGRVELGEEWVIELPPGGVYGDLASKAHRIPSWLGVPDEYFTMRPGTNSREVILLSLDEPLYSRVPALPDLHEALSRGMLPVGYDMNGRVDEIPSPVGKTQMLVAGSTGGGKTEMLKYLAYIAVVLGWDLVIVDGKGDGDFAYLEKVCLIYEEVPDHRRMMQVNAFVEKEHLRRAAENAKSVRSGAGKVQHRPLLYIVDEVSTYTDEADSKKEGAEFETKMKVLSRKVRSSRILVVLSTQNPKAEVINTSIRGNHRTRIAFGCADREQSDVILGGGTAKAGYDASKLPDIPGVAILQVMDKNCEIRGFMVSDEEINAAVDARMNEAHQDEPENVSLIREAYGDDEFLSTAEFASRLRAMGVDIPGDDDAATGKAVSAWLSEAVGRPVPAVQEGRVRGRWLRDIVDR
ncbi:type IV secretory system conjugative DNA transfer family protein [Streptomyces sp. Da 82-17]|uniref:type IV secretory system conjugative DNA transfer family protein n=1 Tax=Streptomyces sp. Da 82-17 TaxID=3377116 RepID=UPI0038D392EB